MKSTCRGIKGSFWLLIMLMIGSASLYAQVDERTVKLSGNYFWGEGFGEDRQSAINNAKRDLIERMIVRIESEANFSERDTNTDYEVALETTTNTMSRMELRGLNYLPAEERRDGTWEAISYISKENFDATMALEEERLLSALALALNDETAGRLDAAIPQYMEILASTFYSPVPFYTSLEDHGTESELRAFLNSKIRSWVNTLDIELQNVRSLSTPQNSEFYFDLGFKFNEMATSHLEIALNKAGYASHPIRNGKTSIFYDLAPEEVIRSFTFTLSPIIPSTIDDEKAGILDGILPIRELTLDIDFSEVIDIDFDIVEEDENTFTFVPEIENLSVYSLEWDFGDGESSDETSPTHNFGSAFEGSRVTLTINSSDELTKSKAVGEISQPTPPPAPRPQPRPEPEEEEKFEIPSTQESYVDNIIRLTDGQSLTRYLNQLRERGIIDLGRRSDIPNPNSSYLAVINPQSRRVIAVLSPMISGNRINLISNQKIAESDLADTFRGFGSVWFQFK